MKRVVFILILMLAGVAGYARPRALGVRAGLEYQISYQHATSERGDFLEIDCGFQMVSNLVNLALSYDFMLAQPNWTSKGTWGVYLGPAVEAGVTGVGYCVSVGVQVGMEYTFGFPLQISIDMRPALGIAVINRTPSFYGGESTLGGCPCLSLRYRFGRR